MSEKPENTPSVVIEEAAKREAVKRIQDWIQSRHEGLPEPRHGKAVWKSHIALLGFLLEEAIQHPDRSVAETRISSECLQRPGNSRTYLAGLRERLQEYSAGSGSQEPIKVIMPPRKNLLAFEWEQPGTPPIPPRDYSAIAAEFWRLLLAICRDQRLTPQDVEDRFWEGWVDDPNHTSDFNKLAETYRELEHPERQTEFLRHLDDLPIPLEDMRSIGTLFGIHPLMFDPLLSTTAFEDSPVKAHKEALPVCLKTGFFEPPVREPATYTRKNARYSIPQERLANTDAALVQLSIEEGGKSDTHEHPGDEMLLVLSGKIEFRLEHSGVSIVLNPGDYIHFYAEQRHSVLALERCKLFIIRLYQIEAADTRQEMRWEVEDCLKQATPQPLSGLSLDWIQQLIASRPQTGPARLLDKVGFARMLRRIRRYKERCGVRLEAPSDQNRMQEWENAKGEIGARQLEEIATYYKVESFLLRPYLSPALPNVVVVRNDEFDKSSTKPGEYVYKNPFRNLACSDITIAEMTLEPGGASPVNDHPGFELLIPRTGAGMVYYVEDEKEVEACRFSQPDEVYAHYTSERPHRARNIGDQTMTCLVVRFHRDGPPKDSNSRTN